MNRRIPNVSRVFQAAEAAGGPMVDVTFTQLGGNLDVNGYNVGLALRRPS